MKYAILILLFVLYGCRSSSSSVHSSLREDKEVIENKETKTTISREKNTHETATTTTNTQIDEYTRTTKYNPNGSVSEIQEQRRTTGRNELEDSSRSGSDVSGVDSASTSNTNSKTIVDKSDERESKGDSRIIQGKEWLCIVVPIIVILFIIWFIKRKK